MSVEFKNGAWQKVEEEEGTASEEPRPYARVEVERPPLKEAMEPLPERATYDWIVALFNRAGEELETLTTRLRSNVQDNVHGVYRNPLQGAPSTEAIGELYSFTVSLDSALDFATRLAGELREVLPDADCARLDAEIQAANHQEQAV